MAFQELKQLLSSKIFYISETKREHLFSMFITQLVLIKYVLFNFKYEFIFISTLKTIFFSNPLLLKNRAIVLGKYGSSHDMKNITIYLHLPSYNHYIPTPIFTTSLHCLKFHHFAENTGVQLIYFNLL